MKRGLEELEEVLAEVVSTGRNFIILKTKSGKKIKRTGGTLSWRNNNPGNIKFGPFAKANEAIGAGAGNHAVFPTYLIGKQAIYNLLFTNQRKYSTMPLKSVIAMYAPVDDPNAKNNPKKYAEYLASAIGVPEYKVLNTFSEEEKEKMIDAIIHYEGYKSGKITEV